MFYDRLIVDVYLIVEIIYFLCVWGADIFFYSGMFFVGKRTNSARVFSVLSWSRHTKSSTFTKDDAEFSSPSEPCRPGAHCATLKKLYAAEKKLYKAVKVSQ